jgi:hypothetical protein
MSSLEKEWHSSFVMQSELTAKNIDFCPKDGFKADTGLFHEYLLKYNRIKVEKGKKQREARFPASTDFDS